MQSRWFLIPCLILWKSYDVVNAIVAKQTDYPACPINFSPQYYCCDHGDGNKFIYTLYQRPYGQDFEEDYQKNWEDEDRQVNIPYHRHTPNTPKFKYGDPNSICRIQRAMVKDENGLLSLKEELQCASQNKTLSLGNSSLFMTYPGNARNNNASCPIGASFTSLMVNGVVDLNLKSACVGSAKGASPKFTTYLEPPFIVLYSMFLVGAIGGFFWMLTRYSSSRSTLGNSSPFSTDSQNSKLLAEGPTRVAAMSGLHPSVSTTRSETKIIRNSDDIEQQGYNDRAFGKVLFSYIVFLSIVLNLAIIVLIMDMNQAFGAGGLMGKMTPILSAFIIIYLFTYLWMVVLIWFQDKLINFFRVAAPLNSCEHVHMYKPEYAEILLTDYSGVSDLLASLKSMLCSSSKRGFEATVPVKVSHEKRYIEFQNLRYIYDEASDRFVPTTIEMPIHYKEIAVCSNGLSNSEYRYRLELVGPNCIEINMPSIGVSIAKEFLSFFYLYQLMGYYIWFFYGYWYMAIIMTFIVIASASASIYYKRLMQASVVQMSKYSCDIDVCRDHQWLTVSSKELVPGDLIRVAENMTLPCDMIIVKGATVCDESMLTGESMPVQKFPIPEDNPLPYEVLGSGKKHTLFSGTIALSSGRNEEILAVVQTTGAHTTKGQLIQTILFPIPMRFKYDEHLKVIFIALLVYALIACCICVEMIVGNGNLANYLDIFNYVNYSIVGIVSPLIPVVITVAQVNASKRLQELGIFCLNSQRITLAGKVRVFCFDKTGTLTKEGLDFLGCFPMVFETNRLGKIVRDVPAHDNLEPLMAYSLASCHSVGSLDGELVGNQVEVKMFKGSGWKLIESEGQMPIVESPKGVRLQVIKRYEFDHRRMSMSVVMRDMNTGKLYIFCKGSYEKIKILSSAESLPSDFIQQSEKLAKNGCYVLGMAFKELPTSISNDEFNYLLKSRDAVEEGLSFLGLILFRNELKEDTTNAIKSLRCGDVRTVMITGDNAMTGCFIARECEMVNKGSKVILGDMVSNEEDTSKTTLQWNDVDSPQNYSLETVRNLVCSSDHVELAVTGSAFDFLVATGQIQELLPHIRIFSRMTPDGKVRCVQLHIEAGAVTGMCGDGGNDCGALRQAHVGVALSNAEASIVSPFTSKSKTITSVVDLCREGRCSVATSFAGVKFLVIYGLISSSLRFIMFYNSVLMSEWFFVYADAFTSVGLTFFMTRSCPLPILGNRRPTSTLLGPTTLCSLLGQMLINICFLTFALRHLTHQRWYCPFNPGSVDLSHWWEYAENSLGSCVAFVIIFQQQTSAMTFSFGSYYRQPVWKNYGLVGLYIFLVAADLFLILGPPNWISDLLTVATGTNVVGLPDITLPFKFRLEFLGFLLGNFIMTVLYEKIVILGPVRDFFHRRYHKDRLHIKL